MHMVVSLESLMEVSTSMTEQEKIAFDAGMLGELTQHLGQFKAMASHIPGALGGMAGTHVAVNSVLKPFLKGKFKGDKLQRTLGRVGFTHATQGKQIHPQILTMSKQLLSPELGEAYTMGAKLGEGYRKNPGKFVNSFKTKGEALDQVGPIAKYVRQGVANKIESLPFGLSRNSIPKPATSRFGEIVQNAKNKIRDKFVIPEEKAKSLEKSKSFNRIRHGYEAVSGVGALMGIPILGDHIAVNTVRGAIARTPKGLESVKNRIMGGLTGKPESKLKRMAIDYGVSPGYGMTRDMGTNIRKAVPEPARPFLTEENAKKHLSAFSPVFPDAHK